MLRVLWLSLKNLSEADRRGEVKERDRAEKMSNGKIGEED